MTKAEDALALEIRLLEDMGRRYGANLERSRQDLRRRIRAAQARARPERRGSGAQSKP